MLSTSAGGRARAPRCTRGRGCCRRLLPGEDSNLQPSDYTYPEVSLWRGLSHCHTHHCAAGTGRLVSEPSRRYVELGCGLPWRSLATGFPQFTQLFSCEFPPNAAINFRQSPALPLRHRGRSDSILAIRSSPREGCAHLCLTYSNDGSRMTAFALVVASMIVRIRPPR